MDSGGGGCLLLLSVCSHADRMFPIRAGFVDRKLVAGVGVVLDVDAGSHGLLEQYSDESSCDSRHCPAGIGRHSCQTTPDRGIHRGARRMWLTVDGPRRLEGDEAFLVCRAVAAMLSGLVAETEDDAESENYGIDWFDQWEPGQRIWLLDQVATALLTDQSALAPAAIWEATIDAIFQHVFVSLEREIDVESIDNEAGPTHESESWCQSVMLAFEQHGRRATTVNATTDDPRAWRRLVMQIADLILGVTSYQAVESYRDGDVAQVARFLQQKGLPADFLEQIPPLVSRTQTTALLEHLRRLLAPFGC